MSKPSAETLHHAIKNLKEPVLFHNILKTLKGEHMWEILNWDLETFSAKFGEKVLPFRTGHKARTMKPQWEVKSPIQWMTMKEFINTKDILKWYYFDYKHMHEWCQDSPEILNSFSWEIFGFNLRGNDSTIWIGNEGAHTSCHQDSYGSNLVAQIYGQKEWILFPPEASEKLRPTRVPFEESTIYSSMNFFSPSQKEESCIKEISGARLVTLNAGDVLFIPKGWWHYVESLNLTISVNIWLPSETDCKDRLKESLVKLMINEIGKSISTVSENEKCSILESINFIRTSLEECNKQKEIYAISKKMNEEEVWTTTSLKKVYPSFIILVQRLKCTELQNHLLFKRNRFSTFIDNTYAISKEEIESANQQLMEKIINAFCNPKTIENTSESLFNDYSVSQ